jgi:non-ribosomal peptide synthetase component F
MHQVTRWNATRTEYPRWGTIHGLFEEQAALAPDAVAVLWDGGALRYGELNRQANYLAAHLVRLGIDRDALAAGREPELVRNAQRGGAALPPAHLPVRAPALRD